MKRIIGSFILTAFTPSRTMSVSTTRIYLGVRIVHIFKINRINKSKKEKNYSCFTMRLRMMRMCTITDTCSDEDDVKKKRENSILSL